MMLRDCDWINKGCTVEILYGEHRSFIVRKEFKVLALLSDKDVEVLVEGKPIVFRKYELKLLDKPGYTKVSEGKWIPDYLIKTDD